MASRENLHSLKEDAGAVTDRLHGKGPQGAKPKAKVVADILAAIKERRA